MGLWYDQHEINERSMMSGKQGVSSHRAQIVRAARHLHAKLDAPLRRAAFTPRTSSPASSAGRWKVPARRGCGRVPRRGASAPTAGSDPACATAAGRAAKRAAKSRYKKAAQHHFAQHHFGRTDAASPLAHFPVSKTSLGQLSPSPPKDRDSQQSQSLRTLDFLQAQQRARPHLGLSVRRALVMALVLVL